MANPLKTTATRWPYWFALAGIVSYNNWLLALILNPHAIWAGATTSELGVRGQPWANLFRSLDIASGVCFLLGIGAVAAIARTHRQRWILYIGMLALGISTIMESIFRLSCASALSAACAAEEHAEAVRLAAFLSHSRERNILRSDVTVAASSRLGATGTRP